MRFLQFAFIAVLGMTALATVATSATLKTGCEVAAQVKNPAPTNG
ncbi:hypothetical protein [Loktanella sp. Alg231-35]|nr:hypothetical protein [Loktanella sp. Alg231-35]